MASNEAGEVTSIVMQPVSKNRFWFAAILVSGGFFGAAAGKNITKPTPLISVLYVGIFVLATSVVTLGIALIKNSCFSLLDSSFHSLHSAPGTEALHVVRSNTCSYTLLFTPASPSIRSKSASLKRV
jgi:hypothetical protein